MHPDDLNYIWICEECKTRFSFTSDIEEHKTNTGHRSITKIRSITDQLPV